MASFLLFVSFATIRISFLISITFHKKFYILTLKKVPEIQGLLKDEEKAQKNNGCDFFFQFRKGKTKLSKMV